MGAKPILVSPLEGHRLWSGSYDCGFNPLLALEQRILSPRLGDLTGKWLVELACGTGRWLTEALVRGASVIGLDRSPEMLAIAAAKHDLIGRLVLADASALPIPDRAADVALCAFALGYVPSRTRALRELARVTRPGGAVFVTDMHPRAIQSGWTRSFRCGAASYEIQHRPYTTSQLLEAGRVAGLEPVALLEPRFGAPEREIFRRAGKEDAFDAASQVPAVVLVEWKRP